MASFSFGTLGPAPAPSPLVVLVVAMPPMARLIASLGSAVEPLPHAPKGIHPADIGRIGVVHDAVLEDEGAHAGPLTQERGLIDSTPPYVPLEGARSLPRVLATIVVFDSALTLLFLLSETDAIGRVEITAERGCPREPPAHALLVRLQLREWRARYGPEHHVVVGQMNLEAIEPVRYRRARRTAGGVLRSEHEVINKELRAISKEIEERSLPLIGFESIVFVNPNPRQLLPHNRQLVAAPRVFLLSLEQLEPRREHSLRVPI